MASTYSDLKIELIGTGEQTGTWGTTTNDNFSIAIGEAITGSADVAFSSADVTVTLTNTNASQAARNLRLNLTGTSGGARQLILGSGCQIDKLYLINNGLADAVTVKNTSGTGIAVPAGKTMFVYNNGTNVVDAITYLSAIGTGVFDAGTVSAPSITFTGDTNTGIYSPAADTIGFTEGGVEGLRINSNGQTSTSIAGTASLPSFTRTGDENTGIFFPAADTIAFTEGGVESMRIDSSGRVLIGSTGSVGNANANNLELTNPAGSGVCGLTLNVNSGSANTGNIYWRSNASNNAIQLVGDPITNYFAIATAGAEAMRINSSGNVGIGASNPAYKLDVNGADNGLSINIRNVSGTDRLGFGYVTSAPINNIIQAQVLADGGNGSLLLSSRTNTNSSIKFYTCATTSAVERMIIDGSGNVGIGTSSPVGQLTLNGSSDLNFLQAGYGISWGATSGSAPRIIGSASDAIRFIHGGGSEAMRIDSSGNVIVGATSQIGSAKFGVQRSTAGECIRWTDGATGGAITTVASFGTNINSDALSFTTNSTERMRIDSSGNLLLNGTVAAGSTGGLTANVAQSGSVGTQISLRNSGTGNGSGSQINFRGVSNTGAEHDYGYVAVVADDTTAKTGSMRFSTTAGSSPLERMRITSAGNVGIGTSSPAVPLEVVGQIRSSTSTQVSMYIFGAAGVKPIFRINEFGVRDWDISAGNFSSGTFSIQSAGSNGVYLNGAAATSWSSASDERVKTNLKPIEDAATKVSTLRAVTGRYKTDEVGVSRSFLIAQDVQAVLPEAVGAAVMSDGSEVLGLAYTEVIPLLVAAIKELKAELDSVKAELQTLKGN